MSQENMRPMGSVECAHFRPAVVDVGGPEGRGRLELHVLGAWSPEHNAKHKVGSCFFMLLLLVLTNDFFYYV